MDPAHGEPVEQLLPEEHESILRNCFYADEAWGMGNFVVAGMKERGVTPRRKSNLLGMIVGMNSGYHHNWRAIENGDLSTGETGASGKTDRLEIDPL